MRFLADTLTMPPAVAAAVYEADGADTDFMTQWTPGRSLADCEWMRTYRTTAETVMERGLATIALAQSLDRMLTAATARANHHTSTITRRALAALTDVRDALTSPDHDPMGPLPTGLISALEDQCMQQGLITLQERATCPEHLRPVDECVGRPH
ncbi:hypothetical protein ACGRHY_26755 [Streptomyces sp. HK10]|uniref:hypothetical protein n=1 Tax=Streptomyces sp. HK10 TaxID=3373255 RepID=UPI0037484A08